MELWFGHSCCSFFPSCHVFYVFVHILSFHFRSSHNIIYIYIVVSIATLMLELFEAICTSYFPLHILMFFLFASYFLLILVWCKGGGRCWDGLKHMWRWISLESIEWTLSKENILPSIILISLSIMSPKSFWIKNHISCSGTIYKCFIIRYQTLN
jgi:hypothetical protein